MAENGIRYSIHKIFEDDTPTRIIKKSLTWSEAKRYVVGDNEDDEFYLNIIEESA